MKSNTPTPLARATVVVVVALCAAGVGSPAPSAAQVLCPRVTSEHNADTTDLTRFRQYHRWREKEGNALAIAVWQYLCDRETGLYHMNTVNDGSDPWSEYSTVRDPLKLINVYNVGYCGIFGPVLDGIFQGIGFPQGRSFGVSGWNHCTTEVWYDGGWHYLDLDVRGTLLKPDGAVASLEEARTDRRLWTEPPCPIEPFFPKDLDKGRVFEIYRDSRIDYFYRWFQMGHTMDFRLRPGESLTRWWRPQDGRWHHQSAYNTGFVRELLEREPRGYKSNHPEFSIWTQGNGLWHYAPDLTEASCDFQRGVYSADNLAPGPAGLQLETPGVGEAVFEVFTPWIIVPQVNDLDDTEDDSRASVVALEVTRPVRVLVSRDHGASWQLAATATPAQPTVDLTPWVAGGYGYLLKLQTDGDSHQPVIRRLTLDTWVQVAPISLPRLARGQNRCCYAMGDRYGRLTQPMFVLPNAADPEDLRKYVRQLPDDYDVERRTARIRGDVVLEVAAPPGSKIAWLTPGACFNTFQNDAARNTDNRIAYAVNRPVKFQEIYRADVPTWVNHWRYQWDQDLLLDEPAQTVFVRYTGRPGVNVLRATAHLIPDRKSQTAIEITHAYRQGSQVIEHVVRMAGPGEYTVDVDGEPENLFLRMAVPSSSH
jgi:hypothetical protein